MGKKEFNAAWDDYQIEMIVSQIPSSFEVGLLSDTHFGNKSQQITAVRESYRIFKERNVGFVIHAGDLVDKYCFKRDHGEAWTKSNIIDYVIDQYPRTGLTTFVLAGNHDKIPKRKLKQNSVRMVTNYRDDFSYIGEDYGSFIMNGLEFYVNHENGIGEQERLTNLYHKACFQNYDADIIIAGHLHKWGINPTYHQSFICQLPSMTSEGPESGAAILHVNPKFKWIEPLGFDVLTHDW